MEAALHAARRAGDLTHQLLVYSGRGQFEMECFDLNQLIREMSSILPPTVSRSAQLVFDLRAAPAWILGDRMQVWQVIMNLIINASEAVQARRGRIDVATSTCSGDESACSCGTVPPSGPSVRVDGQDDGPGMEESALGRIFEPFFTTKGKGRGLGLAAAPGIVRAHGGCICVESTPGHGSRFSAVLPLAAAPQHPAAPVEPPPAPRDGQIAEILIAEDEADIRPALAHTLQAAGWACTMAGNGREAVSRFAEAPARYAAVLLDLIMPEMDGREAFLEIERIRPEVAIILMSGYSTEDWRDLLPRAAGAICRPFTRERLIAVLRNVRPAQSVR
jgi:two-component system, cell cycle sensor histidine kinase and response regulator CckA